MIPLAMTGEPFEHSIVTVAGTERKCTMLQTNKGPLTVAEAARLLQIVPGTLRSRIRRCGWAHPDVVQVGELTPYRVGAAENRQKADELTAGEFKSLGTKARPEKLASLGNPGTWERKHIPRRWRDDDNPTRG